MELAGAGVEIFRTRNRRGHVCLDTVVAELGRREILQAIDKGNDRARLAYGIYAHRLTREIGAMLAVLGGVDAIVFTGGIGENCAPLRKDVCAQLEFLGLKLDTAKNAQPHLDQNIAAAGSSIQVLVIRADEDGEIARECRRLIPAG